MTTSSSTALGLSRGVLKTLRVLNVLYGAFIVLLFILSFTMPELLFRAIGVKDGPGRDEIIAGGRMMMIAGLIGLGIVHLVLTRLLEIVETVRAGDPFIIENARRLTSIAWLMLGGEMVHLAVGAIARYASSGGQVLDINWSLSLTPWIALLLLFVLARVFEHGARMREDLAGTV